MEKCTKCGSVISDNDPMAWKCTECGKAFRINLSRLKKLCVLKDKPENAGKALLKCSTCGNGLDNGNEMIACKCSACGNIMSGSLRDFADGDKCISSYGNKNASTHTIYPQTNNQIKNNHYTQSASPEQDFKPIHKICLACIIISIFVSVVSIIYIKNPNLWIKDFENSKNSKQALLENLDKNTTISNEKTHSDSTYAHTCEADGCNNEGIKCITGLNDTLEYYCLNHYQELENMLDDIIEDTSQPAAFTNIRASSTTKCAHSGCNNYIAPSGDTSYCVTHSHKCLECGIYIDEDALFCVYCIVEAFDEASE